MCKSGRVFLVEAAGTKEDRTLAWVLSSFVPAALMVRLRLREEFRRPDWNRGPGLQPLFNTDGLSHTWHSLPVAVASCKNCRLITFPSPPGSFSLDRLNSQYGKDLEMNAGFLQELAHHLLSF
jgi:hypothetical protein